MRKFIGLVLVLIGALVLADNLKVFGDNISLWNYTWTTFLIILGLYGLIRKGSFRVLSVFFIAVGGFYLAQHMGVEWLQEKNLHLFALLLVLLGVQLLFFSGWTKITRRSSTLIKPSKHNGREFSAFMGGMDEKVFSEDFKGCNITAIMGGAEIDLSDVKINQDVRVECTAIMGAVEVTLPRNVRILVTGTPVMGGYENTNPGDPTAPYTIFISYTAVMGAVEIR